MSNELKKQQVLLKTLLHVMLKGNWLYRKKTYVCSKCCKLIGNGWKTSAKEFATVVRAERKLAIQKEQLHV
jgi:hypothetical protein